jgi:hypothetical protein
MEEQKLIIPIDKIKEDFKEFLSPNNNRRIIFSGPFGIGKTYFLHEFFKEKKEEYFTIFLRPINYSLLSNEDVFKFVKYDILIQLIDKQIVKIGKDLSVSRISTAKSIILNNKLLILKNLLKVIPNLGGASEGIDLFQELYKKYHEGLEKAKKFDNALVKDFKDDLENNFLIEFDKVSEFIQEKLKNIGTNKILIIDDLDRLDPEHIFRLFNVFSAHFDQIHYYDDSKGNDNKFGFNKIIFVCDIENIRKIFAHKYGSEVDFSGYIDKFYSSEIYNFNNNQEIINYVDAIFQVYENNESRKGGSQNEILGIVKPIFSDFILAGAVNFRVIENIKDKKIKFRNPYTINYFKPENVRNYHFKAIQAIDFLINTFGGDINNLLSAIKRTKTLKRNIASTFKEDHLSYFLPILNANNKLKDSTWESPWNTSLTYKLIPPSTTENSIYYADIRPINKDWIKSKNYYDFFELVVKNLQSMGVFDFNSD